MDSETPFAFAYIKSYIDKYLGGKIEFKVLDDIDDLKNDDYDILGLSSYTHSFNEVDKIVTRAREINEKLFIMLGSYHISSIPDSLPSNVDCGVTGEGEETVKEILELMIEDRINYKDNLSKIKGLVLRDQGHIILTPQRDLINPLDSIPFPDRNIVKSSQFLQRNISSSRGCPYKCAFCAFKVWTEKYRYFSAEYVVSEIEHIVNNYANIKNIQFIDDLFIGSKSRLKGIVDGINAKEINKYVNFNMTVRANLIDDETCTLLKKMNVAQVMLGLESTSQKLLNNINKQLTVEQNEAALDLLYKYGIAVNASFIFGIPGETLCDFYNTADFIMMNKRKGKINGFGIYVLTPFPGTYYWQYAQEKGLISDDMDYAKLGDMVVGYVPPLYEFSEWRKLREGYSIYLNDDNIKEEVFYDLLEQFFNEFKPLVMGKGKI